MGGGLAKTVSLRLTSTVLNLLKPLTRQPAVAVRVIPFLTYTSKLVTLEKK